MNVRFTFTINDGPTAQHTVDITVSDSNLTATCTCDVNQDDPCDHKMLLLTGDGRQVMSGNQGAVRDLLDYLPECDVWPHLERFLKAKTELASAQSKYTAAVEQYAKAKGTFMVALCD